MQVPMDDGRAVEVGVGSVQGHEAGGDVLAPAQHLSRGQRTARSDVVRKGTAGDVVEHQEGLVVEEMPIGSGSEADAHKAIGMQQVGVGPETAPQ